MLGGDQTLGERGRWKKCTSIYHCLLLLRFNQSTQNKGLSMDIIRKEQIETGKPAFQFAYHLKCNQNLSVQAVNKAGVRIRSAAAIPHIFPQPALLANSQPVAGQTNVA